MVLTFFFLFFGYGGLTSLKSESFPTVNLGQVIITTRYLGATAEDIESKITKPIEDEIRAITGLKEVRSVSQPGESKIITTVDVDNYDVEEVISDLQRSVDRVPNLPQDLENPPAFAEIKTDEFPVIELSIVGSNENRLRDRAAIELEEDLEDNQSISSIRKTGFRERQLTIQVDADKLNRHHVGLNEVTRAIANQNVTIPGGTLESNGQQTLVKIDGKLKTVKEIENIVIRSNFSGSKITIKDIATVIDDEEDARTLNRYQGQESTTLVISKKSGADILALAQEVKDKVELFNKKYKDQLQFSVYSDEGVRVGNRLDVLSSNGLAGLVLVVFFLIIFLPGRVGIMASFSLPLAIFATFGYIQASGMSLNTITILAIVISIGMLVDNAVVIAENFVRLKNEGRPAKKAALESIETLWLPITATALTTIAAFLPMLVTKGILGQFIKGIPLVVTASLIISLIECFILLPVRLVKKSEIENELTVNNNTIKQQPPKKDWFQQKIIPAFEKCVSALIRFRYISAIGFVGIIAFAIFMMTKGNKFILFPADQTEIYIARLEMAQGTTIENTHKKMAEVSDAINNSLGDSIKAISATSGVAEQDPNDPKGQRGESVGLLRIFMTESAKNELKTNDVLAKLREIELTGIKELTFEAYINGPPVGAPLTAIFRSNDAQQLEEVVEIMKQKLSQVDGVYDIKIDDVFGEDEVQVDINPAKADRLGLSTFDIGSTVRTAIAGVPVTDVNINNRDVNYFVRLKPQQRKNLDDLTNLKIMNRQQKLIPLSRVARFTAEDPKPHIKRFDYKPAKTIAANVNDDIITSVAANAKALELFTSLQDKYKDVSFKFGGEGERTQESFESLMQALLLSLIGIFALLVFLFKSYIKPIIILTTIPLGLVGVSISFYLHQRPISFLALIGVVGLGGIIVNSGIVLISFIETLKKEKELPIAKILVQATGMRLKAVVVTSLTTVSGLLPTAYGIGGADDFIIPMTLAMAWGLVSGTILALLWVPCAYAITEDLSRFFEKCSLSVKKIFPENLVAKRGNS